MKKIINRILLLVAFGSILSSCSEGNEGMDSKAQPKINYVRSVEAEKADSLIVGASMGETIAIMGSGLEGVVEVKFNDQLAMLNPVFVTSEDIVCTIPAVMPGEVTNLLTVTTKQGKSCTIDFAVTIPSPVVRSISCEWAPDASAATIYGESFFAKEDGTIEVLFPGNMPAEVTSFTDTEIQVVVPTGTQAGLITVINDYGKGNSQFTFRDSEGIFIDGENPEVWNGWGLSAFDTADGLDGAYVKLEGATGAWAWPANTIQMYYQNPSYSPLVTEGEVSDYALRFECRCFEWHDTPMLVWFDDGVEAHAVDGSSAQYHWRPYLTAPDTNYVTDGWVTITMPLADFTLSKDESETDRSIGSLSELVNLNIIFFGATDTETEDFDLKIGLDNMRLVKLK